MESQEAFKDLLLSENTSSLLSFLSCLARKIPKKMSGPPLDKEGGVRLICVYTHIKRTPPSLSRGGPDIFFGIFLAKQERKERREEVFSERRRSLKAS